MRASLRRPRLPHSIKYLPKVLLQDAVYI